jgi:hypothetical protein
LNGVTELEMAGSPAALGGTVRLRSGVLRGFRFDLAATGDGVLQDAHLFRKAPAYKLPGLPGCRLGGRRIVGHGQGGGGQAESDTHDRAVHLE